MPGFGAFDGTYVSAEGRVQKIKHVFAPPAGKDGYSVLGDLIFTAGGKRYSDLNEIDCALSENYPIFAPGLLGNKEFLAEGPVRYQTGYYFLDGRARLKPVLEKSPLFGSMVFADVPLVTWFGQLVSEGLLKY
jgi:predicted molibdopterin-dependent oxidoreductase YjgC